MLAEGPMTLSASYHAVFEWLHFSGLKLEMRFLTFALHHAVKTIQGRGCDRRSTPRVISGATDELFSGKHLSIKKKKKDPRPQIGLSVSHNRPATSCRGEVIQTPPRDSVVCIHLVQSFKEFSNMCKLHFVIEGIKCIDNDTWGALTKYLRHI